MTKIPERMTIRQDKQSAESDVESTCPLTKIKYAFQKYKKQKKKKKKRKKHWGHILVQIQ